MSAAVFGICLVTGLQKVRSGVSHTRHDPVLFTGAAASPSTPF